MENKQIHPNILAEMGEEWEIEISDKPFTEGKSLNMPALGYACAACGGKDTTLCFAESTEEEESSLLWMELKCKTCKTYTHYTRK